MGKSIYEVWALCSSAYNKLAPAKPSHTANDDTALIKTKGA